MLGRRERSVCDAAAWCCCHMRGCAAAAFCLKNTADNMIEVALQQTGCEDAHVAAARALAADKQSAGVIRVAVRELEGTREHAVFLGGEVVPPAPRRAALHDLPHWFTPGNAAELRKQ